MENEMETTTVYGGYIGISRGCRDLGSRGL